MITWMQRHKKYLIVTIWISVIAFVGAGFVGWGTLDFNSARSSSVAKVGNHKISFQSFNRAYGNFYNYYNTLYNGQLTEEIAKESGLDRVVLDTLINEAILLNFADELGIVALDSDITDLILADPTFQINGTFSKELYFRVLQESGLKPAEHESMLAKQAVLNKIYPLIDLPASELEKEVVGAAMFLQDRISYAIVTVDNSEVGITEDDIKAYWEPNKGAFLSEKTYHFESLFVPASTEKLAEDDIKSYWEETKYFYKDSEEKVLDYDAAKVQAENALRLKNAEKDSLKAYLALKKGEIAAEKNITITEANPEYDAEAFQTLSAGDVLNPIQKANGYEILRLTSVSFPEPKSYEEVKNQVLNILFSNKKMEILVKRAEARLSLFNGRDIGFVGRDDNSTIAPGLTQGESTQLIRTAFDAQDKKGYILLSDKAVLYGITEQRLPNESKLGENDEILTQGVRQIKSTEIKQALINLLKPRYKIEQYYKG